MENWHGKSAKKPLQVQSTLSNSPSPIASGPAKNEGATALGQTSLTRTSAPQQGLAPGQGATGPESDSLATQAASKPKVQLAPTGAQPWPFPYGAGCPLEYWGIPGPMEHLPIKDTFDGSPEKLEFFLNQV